MSNFKKAVSRVLAFCASAAMLSAFPMSAGAADRTRAWNDPAADGTLIVRDSDSAAALANEGTGDGTTRIILNADSMAEAQDVTKIARIEWKVTVSNLKSLNNSDGTVKTAWIGGGAWMNGIDGGAWSVAAELDEEGREKWTADEMSVYASLENKPGNHPRRYGVHAPEQ